MGVRPRVLQLGPMRTSSVCIVFCLQLVPPDTAQRFEIVVDLLGVDVRYSLAKQTTGIAWRIAESRDGPETPHRASYMLARCELSLGCRKLDRLDRHEIIADPELGSIENSLRLPQSKSNA